MITKKKTLRKLDRERMYFRVDELALKGKGDNQILPYSLMVGGKN